MKKPELRGIGKPPGTQGWEGVGAGLGGPTAQPQPQGSMAGPRFLQWKLRQPTRWNRGRPSRRALGGGRRGDPAGARPRSPLCHRPVQGGSGSRGLQGSRCPLPLRAPCALSPATRSDKAAAADRTGWLGRPPRLRGDAPVERRQASLSGPRRPPGAPGVRTASQHTNRAAVAPSGSHGTPEGC